MNEDWGAVAKVTAGARNRGAKVALVLVLSVVFSCSETPTSVLLTVYVGPAVIYDRLTLSAFTDQGLTVKAHPLTGLNEQIGPQGTVVLYPEAGVSRLRLLGRAWWSDEIKGEGVVPAFTVKPGAQRALSLSLSEGTLPDADKDGVPDLIDKCKHFKNPDQLGPCPGDGGVPDGGPEDGGPKDAGVDRKEFADGPRPDGPPDTMPADGPVKDLKGPTPDKGPPPPDKGPPPPDQGTVCDPLGQWNFKIEHIAVHLTDGGCLTAMQTKGWPLVPCGPGMDAGPCTGTLSAKVTSATLPTPLTPTGSITWNVPLVSSSVDLTGQLTEASKNTFPFVAQYPGSYTRIEGEFDGQCTKLTFGLLFLHPLNNKLCGSDIGLQSSP